MKRLVFLLIWLLSAGSLMADDELRWYAITDTGVSIEMSKLGMLVAADDNITFALVAADGNVLEDGVTSIRFEQRDGSAGVEAIRPDDGLRLINGGVSSQLVLTGAKGTISIFSANGAQVLSVQANEGETRLNVQSLPTGVNIVKCGKAAFKFMKK